MNLPTLHDPLLLLLAGMAIDALLGEMQAVFAWVPHPIALAGRAVDFFERRLNRPQRSERRRRERGILTVLVLVGVAAGFGWVVHALCRRSLAGALIEALTIAITCS
jgi:adenosylcobinamide-phosphate synthase